MKKNLLVLLLAILLASSSFTACAKGTDEGGEDSASSSVSDITAETVAEAEETEPEVVTDDLPERNFNDFDFQIYSRQSATHYAYLTEEMTGELLNDAIYERNERVAERFGVVFSESTYSNQNLPVTNVQSGDNTFSLMNVRCTAADTMGQKALCYDMSSLEYIDLSKPYWDAELTKMINVGDRMFTAIGASNMTAIDFMTVMLFNKTLAEQYQIENLYDAVRENRWTFDLFGTYAGQVTADLNGDGTYNENDQWGALGSNIFLHCSLIPAAQAWYIKKDADNIPVFEMASDEHFTNVFEKIFNILHDNNAWYINSEGANDQPNNTVMFRNGQGLFMGSQTFYIESMRDMEYDFGILPFPKYTEEQEEYYSRLCFYDAAVIPVTVPDLECSSIILEALSCDSYNNVVPAYKEEVLKSKFVRDEDSSQMMDIVLAHRVVDMGDTIFCESIRNGFVNPLFSSNSRELASKVQSNEKMLSKLIEKMVDAYIGE